MRSSTSLAIFVAAVAVAACGGSSVDAIAPIGPTGVRGVAGGTTDTVLGTVLPALVVEVRDSSGAVAPSLLVKFTAVQNAPPATTTEVSVETTELPAFAPFASVLTDGAGRASVIVRMGTTAGTARLVVTVPQFGFIDTARFTVTAGSATHIAPAPADTFVYLGTPFVYRGATADRYGNPRAGDAATWTVSSSGAQVSSSGTFSSTAAGAYVVTATNGKFTGTANVTVVPHGQVAEQTLFSNQLIVMDVDGENARLIASGFPQAPVWMPDGNSIVFGALVNDVQVLKTIDLTGTVRSVFPNGIPNVTDMSDPLPTADGQWLYFLATDTRCAVDCLYRSKIDGSAPELIGTVATAGPNNPSPSPDGSKIAYLSLGSSFGGLNVNVIAPGGSTPTTVSSNGPGLTYANLEGWSADGRYLLMTNAFAPPVMIDVQTGVAFSLPGAFIVTGSLR